jgi:hypothetical protein
MTRSTIHPPTILAAAAVLAGVGCDSSSGPSSPDYDPQIPASWASSVSNSFFPLVPGTTLEYAGETDAGLETIIVEVLNETRAVNGVTATVVRDRVYLDGELIEDTVDWYAQDVDGNVWYLGEETKDYENGVLVATAGSWEWGVDNALPGIYMWANPAAHIGEEYRQEYYKDEAEDWAKVLDTNLTVEVPYGTLNGCLRTEDWNGLESGTSEHKYYSPGIGVVLETPADGGSQRIELVRVTRP